MREGFEALTRELERLPQLAEAIVLGIVAWAAVVGLVRVVLRLAESVSRRTQTALDDDLLQRVRTPTTLIGPAVGLHVFAWFLQYDRVAAGASLIETLVLTYIGVSAFEILVVENWLEKRQGMVVPGPMRQLVIAIIYGAVLLGIGGEVFGIDLTPLVATGSVTSLVLGLALQQPLSNLFAGIVLHAERHPTRGDWLMVDGREGEVLEIGWRSTRMRTFSQDVLVVPNTALLNATVVNFSQPSSVCGRTVPVPVPLDVPPHVFDRWAREVLETIDGVEGPWEPRTKTWLVGIEDHCQRFVVRFWAKEFRIHDDCESEVLKRLWYKLAENGVQFPAPFQAVRVVDAVPPSMAALTGSRPASFPPAMPRPTGTGEPTSREVPAIPEVPGAGDPGKS
jgi:small-conductance mechanosensitive channel